MLDRTFHALGDGTRRQMLSMLMANGTLSASQLSAPFDAAQPTISKHIKVLERAELVQREVAGRLHKFTLNQAALQQAEDWIARHRKFWEGTLEQLEQLAFAADEEEPKS